MSRSPPALWSAPGSPLAVEEGAVLVRPCEIPCAMRFLVPAAHLSGASGQRPHTQPASLTSHARFWSRRPSFGDAFPVKARVIRWHETHSGVQLLLLTLPSAAPHSSNTGLWDPPQTADSPRLRPLPGSPAWNASVHLARLSSLDLI